MPADAYEAAQAARRFLQEFAQDNGGHAITRDVASEKPLPSHAWGGPGNWVCEASSGRGLQPVAGRRT